MSKDKPTPLLGIKKMSSFLYMVIFFYVVFLSSSSVIASH